jgi:hypothetical protein
MEYVDSIDELAYITSLEQQNREFAVALRSALSNIAMFRHTASQDCDISWHNVDKAEEVICKALIKAGQ